MRAVDRLLTIARGELGNTESPAGSNRTKYGAAYGWDGVPWCVIFLWWCFRAAKLAYAFFGGAKTASCGTLRAWYKSMGQTVPVSDVRPGDIVLLNFHGGTEAQHCGLVVEPHWHQDGSLDYVYAIEGNTSTSGTGSQDNGGCVAMKRRYPRQIVEVLRPMYREIEDEGREDPSSGPSGHLPPGEGKDWEGHWAAEHIRWAIEQGIMTGYEDGTWQPDKPVTRAELAAVLHRMSGKEA